MKKIICICCPKGCHLQVDETTLAVQGNACERGIAYGQNELTHPVRVVTSTVCVSGAALCRVPVKTNGSVPKQSMQDVMRALDGVRLTAPVKRGDVAVPNVCGTGIDVVVTRSLDAI